MDEETRKMPQSIQQKITQSARDAEVLRLRAEGLTYQEVAKRLGFANRSGAQKAMRRALARIPDEVAEARSLAQARTDALIKTLWPIASDSSHPQQLDAIEQIRHIINDVDRLYGSGAAS